MCCAAHSEQQKQRAPTEDELGWSTVCTAGKGIGRKTRWEAPADLLSLERLCFQRVQRGGAQTAQ